MEKKFQGTIISFKRTILIVLISFLLLGNITLFFSINQLQFSNNSITFPITPKASISDDKYDEIESNIPYASYDDNQNYWYSERIEMIIITHETCVSAMQPLADWKTEKGVPTKIVNSSEYLTYSGADVQEQIRNCIRFYYQTYGIEWVLLAGDTELIPIRYIFNPDTNIVNPGNNEPFGGQLYKPTDFYYAELSGDWDIDNDGKYGESLWYEYGNANDEIDWTTEVYVGRFPGDNVAELATMVNKTIFYEKTPQVGEWMNRILMAGAVQEIADAEDPDGEEEWVLCDKIIDESIPSGTDLTYLWESTSGHTPLSENTLNQANFDDGVDEGNSIVFYAGHGSPTSFQKITLGNDFFSTSDAINPLNYEMPSLFYADACSTNFFDTGVSGGATGNCIGEYLIKNERGGAIGYIGSMRLSWFLDNDDFREQAGPGEDKYLCELNRGMARLFFDEIFNNDNYQQGKALYEMKKAYLDSWWLEPRASTWIEGSTEIDITHDIHTIEWERKNVLSYTLLGDPETDIYTSNNLAEFNSSHIEDQLNVTFVGEEKIFEIVDINGNPISGARLCITDYEGIYGNFIADSTGKITFRMPGDVKNYNFTLTAHNMRVLQGNFTILPDITEPHFLSEISITPTNPTVTTNIIASINASDSESAVSYAYFITSTDNFETYQINPIGKINDDITCFQGSLPKLDFGTYQYLIFIFDYAGNSNHTLLSITNSFTIPIPSIGYFIFGINFVLLLGVAVFLYHKKSMIKNYSRYIENSEATNPTKGSLLKSSEKEN
ncbi:MAG: hypothetical protein GY870_10640 [archaeon]|nr:hypothetical protein [archaeon]